MQIHPGDSNDIEKVIQIDNSNSKKCKCNKIVITQDNICICGKEIDSHDQKTIKAFKSHSESPLNGVSNRKQQEALSENIIMKETRSLDLSVSGEIQFQGTSDNLAKYVKVANEFSEESMKSVMEILFGKNYWSLKEPELIISVTGGAAPLKMNHTFKETFGKGLVKVATNTNALITSGGSYSGCMKLVGEAFKKNALSVDPDKVVNLLGIANWDTIYKKSNFIKTEEHLRKQTTETFMAEYELVKPKECKEVLLDPNHTHFLLVETGSSLGAEVQFRATLEETLARSLNIPITVLVVGGGFRTADSIAEAVQRKTPCVFLESSGEVADIFSFVLTRIEKTKEKNKDKKDYKIATLLQDPNFKEEIKETISIYYKEQAKIDSIMVSIQKAVLNNEQNLNLMTVCRPVNDHADIDVAILRALLRKEKSQESATYLQTQLKLALKWNRIDIAKKFIFTEENTDKIGPLDRAMVIALTNNRVDFVKLFLENDFTLKNFVTNRILIRLYNLTPENTPINRYIRLISKRRHKRFSYRHIGAAIESLLGDSYKHRFSSSHLTKLNSYALQQLISGEDKVEDKNLINAIGSVVGGDYSLPSDIDDKSEYAEHELFMFSVLSGWPELALVFCKDGRNSIMNILMGSKIFKSFAESFENEAATYNQLAKDFETLACDILQVCYESDKDKAEITLTRTIPEFGNYTCIQAAILARDLEFISHPCFQSVLTRVWYNKINPDINKVELGIYTLFPFLSPLYFWSRSKKQYEKNIMIQKISSVDEEINQITSLEENNIHSSRVQLSARTEPTEFVKKTRFNPITNFLDFLNTPLIKFAYHQSCYILFLILFSYVLLCDFNMVYKADPITSQGLVISIPEIVLIIWVATFAVELFRKYFLNEQKTFKARIRTFIFDLWNLIDIASIAIYIVGLVLRFIPDEGCFKAARIVLSIDIIFWFFKSLYTYLFLKSVGPKIYMIWKQTVQLAYFMLIVFLFIFAFGVSTQSLLYENSPLNLTLISQVFFPAYFIMGGEYFTQSTVWTTALNECNGENLFPYSTCPDSIGSSVTLPIYCIYLLFMNILLINLIIAIFNNTYDEIESEGKQIWKYQRYGLVYDFRYKPVIFPPFTIFYYIFIFIQFVVKTVRSVFVKSDESGGKSKMKKIVHFLSTNKATGFVYDFCENPSEEMIIMKWEKLCTNELFQKQENERAETIDSKVEDSQEKLHYLASKLEEFIENGAEDLDARIENLEKNLKNTLNALK